MIMLNHAAWVEYENTQIKFKHKQTNNSESNDNDPLLSDDGSQRLSDLEKDPDAMDRYFSQFGSIGR